MFYFKNIHFKLVPSQHHRCLTLHAKRQKQVDLTSVKRILHIFLKNIRDTSPFYTLQIKQLSFYRYLPSNFEAETS